MSKIKESLIKEMEQQNEALQKDGSYFSNQNTEDLWGPMTNEELER